MIKFIPFAGGDAISGQTQTVKNHRERFQPFNQEDLMSKQDDTQKSTARQKQDGFTKEEKAAMRERARELKEEKKNADLENSLLEKIAEMPEAERALAQRVHEIIKASAPELQPKTWYGMPAYTKDGKVVCFFQAASKFESRYATLGFNDTANLDDGAMWPTAFALKELTPAGEAKISELVKKAVS
jgi:uncharacterized protein YdhG (YjbR/CyaY superfamily)